MFICVWVHMLELELQVVMSCLVWVLGTELWSSTRTMHPIIPEPLKIFFEINSPGWP